MWPARDDGDGDPDDPGGCHVCQWPPDDSQTDVRRRRARTQPLPCRTCHSGLGTALRPAAAALDRTSTAAGVAWRRALLPPLRQLQLADSSSSSGELAAAALLRTSTLAAGVWTDTPPASSSSASAASSAAGLGGCAACRSPPQQLPAHVDSCSQTTGLSAGDLMASGGPGPPPQPRPHGRPASPHRACPLNGEVGAADATALQPLSEDAFIANLHQRYKHDQIYTYISQILVSLNPYKKLPLYTSEVIRAYRACSKFELAPHVYALAEEAYRALREQNMDQCVVVSGESGSGKTEACKLILQYIAAVSGRAKETNVIKNQLLQSNPLLEAFGNAKTSRNDNSSRFGKYMEIEFDYKGDPMGGIITSYMLEKSRVTSQKPGERNFHIFYQLLTGADIPLLKSLKLQRNVDNYEILKLGKPLQYDSLDDKRDFQNTRRALDILGLTPDEQSGMLRVLASVLKLGNISFSPTSNIDGSNGCLLDNEYGLQDACELLQTDASSLQACLTSKCLEDRTEVMVTELSVPEAAANRDALCRALYSRLFTWIVLRINDTIKPRKHAKRKVLSVVDVYGFEVFDHNGFEQFVINFCNEKLQHMYTQMVLRSEQEDIVREGLEWVEVEYFNNAAVCDLIEKNNFGILSILDEECSKLSQASDESFFSRIGQLCGNHPHFEAVLENSRLAHCFRVKHFAGTVTYDVAGFTQKNADCLTRDMSCIMYRCDLPLMKALFPEGNPKRGTLRRSTSTCTQLKISMSALMKNIGCKQAHYVRCVQPNDTKLPSQFQADLVRYQVRYLSLLETARVRRAGFVYRQSYDTFLARYKMLSLHTWPSWRGLPAEGVTYLLRDLPVSVAEYAFGRTKILIRSAETVYELEEYRRERVEDLATMIQKLWRGWRQRRLLESMRNAQAIIATNWRTWKARAELRYMKQQQHTEWAARLIQRCYRCWKRRRFLVRLAHHLPSESPLSRDWPHTPRMCQSASSHLYKLYHKWRCHMYRRRYDQTSRNRMREKVTASIIFKDRKASYPKSLARPYRGDYVKLRRNVFWKKHISLNQSDRHVVYADMVNKVNRSDGQFVPVLFVLSTSSMLILDQRTMQIKYRIPAQDIYRISLSPYLDDIAVFHVRAMSPVREMAPVDDQSSSGCLLGGEAALKHRKGDFVFQTGHVIEIVTKLFLVIQNATGKPPDINIDTEFEANFGQNNVLFTFKMSPQSDSTPGQIRIIRRPTRMEVIL